ncbi:MAG: hypothetical protein IJE62_02825 [Clostridia bacterium]|nr:hypothetical protein [Clostridia bacterium]
MIELIMQIFLQVVISSLKVSIIIILLLLLTKMIEERYSAGFRYYSWLAVIIIFLIPFNSFGLNYKVELPRSALHIQREAQEMFNQISQNMPIYEFEEEISKTGNNELASGHKNSKRVEENVAEHTKSLNAMFLITLIWALGVILYFVIHIKRYSFFKKAVKRFSLPLSDTRIKKILEEEQKRLKISKKIPVRISHIADTPLLTGLFRVMLILPNNNYTDDELHFILRHELIHYKRKDIWYQFLTLIFVSLHWFNPFVYIMAHAIEIDGETSCDEAVLKKNSYETRVFYGEMLIAFLKTENQKKSYLTTTFFGGEKAMKKRLTLIASKKLRKKGIAAMAVLMIITVMMSLTVAATTIEFVDSKEMVKNSSNRENTIIMDTSEGYDVFIGCEPIRETNEKIKVPLKTFIVFIDYKIISEETGKTITISNGNRQIELSANSNKVNINGDSASIKRNIIAENDDFYVYIDDIEALFSYKVSYDLEKNNVVLTVTDETPEAVKTITPPESLPGDYNTPQKVTVMTQGETITILIDDNPVTYPDAQPFIDEQDRTQVPIRALAEMLNCQVIWNEQTQGITIIDVDGTVITTKIGDNKIVADGEMIEMDTTAKIINNRTYLPLRFVSEAFGFNVFWE